MRINVAQLLKEAVGEVRHYEIAETDADMPLEGEARLLRTDRGILVTGRLKTRVRETCSRCLEQFDCPLALEMEEEVFPTRDATTGAVLPVPPEAAFTIDENHELNLGEAVRQYVLLTVPMKPICREDCAGLCPRCGANLNNGPCGCPEEGLDPRWGKLRGLSLEE